MRLSDDSGLSALELNQIPDEEKITGNFHFVKRPKAALQVLPPFSASNPRGPWGAFSIPLPYSISPSPSLFPLIPLCLSFELYPLNLQLWGAAGMRDTFSRKFARRILKPRGKQDQYLVSCRKKVHDGPIRDIPLSFGWPPSRFVCFPSVLPSCLPRRILRRKGRRDIVSQHEGLLWFVCSRKGDLPSFPFMCCRESIIP